MDRKILKLLYRSFDSILGKKEHGRLATALKESEDLQREKEQILSLRRAVSDSAVHSFGPFFAERIMNRLNSIETRGNNITAFFAVFRTMFMWIAPIMFLSLIVLASYNVICGDILSKPDIYYVSDAVIEELLPVGLF